jgi:hypothetical protein
VRMRTNVTSRQKIRSSPFHPNASRGSDGKLWFANGSVVQMIDPAKRIRNAIPPPVFFEAGIADRKNYSPGEDARFRHRLDGRDGTEIDVTIPARLAHPRQSCGVSLWVKFGEIVP